MKIEEVTLHHNNCDIKRCWRCLEDAEKLEEYLRQEIDPTRKIDVLGSYRLWLDNNDIKSENEYGWILPVAYDHKNILEFIKIHKSGLDYSKKYFTERELKERAFTIWSDLKDVVNHKYKLDDKLFLKHPIKSPTFEIIDNITKIFKELETPKPKIRKLTNLEQNHKTFILELLHTHRSQGKKISEAEEKMTLELRRFLKCLK